jgi:hypothetical protein
MKTLLNLRASVTRLVVYPQHPCDPTVRYFDNPHFTVRLYVIRSKYRRRLTEAFGLN